MLRNEGPCQQKAYISEAPCISAFFGAILKKLFLFGKRAGALLLKKWGPRRSPIF
jgi:hypothetical protein